MNTLNNTPVKVLELYLSVKQFGSKIRPRVLKGLVWTPTVCIGRKNLDTLFKRILFQISKIIITRTIQL